MSTNYYANVKSVGDEATPEFRIHLGKTSQNTVMVDGNLFESFESMVAFLRYNKNNVKIESETGIDYTVEDFVHLFKSDISGNQEVFDKYFANTDRHWMDDGGFIVSTGTWF